MSLASIFVGVPQSRYAALAIMIAIVVVSLSILVGKETSPISQKFGFVVLVFLISLPSLALSLFQLTCIVTGAGFKNQRPWCSMYGWLISALMIFYAVLLVFAAVMSLVAPDASVSGKEGFEAENKMQKFNAKTAEYFATAEKEEPEKPEKPVDAEDAPSAPVAPSAPAVPPMPPMPKGVLPSVMPQLPKVAKPVEQFEDVPYDMKQFANGPGDSNMKPPVAPKFTNGPVLGGASVPAGFPFNAPNVAAKLPVPAASQPETFSTSSAYAPF